MPNDLDTSCPYTIMAMELAERSGVMDLWALPPRTSGHWWRLRQACRSRTLRVGIGLVAGGLAAWWLSACVSIPLLLVGLAKIAAEASWFLHLHATDRRKEQRAREEFTAAVDRYRAHTDLRAKCIKSLSRLIATSAAEKRCGNWDKTLFSESAADMAWRLEASLAQHLGSGHALTQQMTEIRWFDRELYSLAAHLERCSRDFTSPEPVLRDWIQRHPTCRPAFRVVIAALADAAANASEARAAGRREWEKKLAMWDEQRKRSEAEAEERARRQAAWTPWPKVGVCVPAADLQARARILEIESELRDKLARLADLQQELAARGEGVQARYVANHINDMRRVYADLR